MAEALLRTRLEHRGQHATISSAGLLYEGEPASPGAIEALGKRDIDLTGHRSHIMTADDLAEADLVLAMARAHVREASVLHRPAFTRTFTLKEFVRRADAVMPDPTETPTEYFGRLAAGRRPNELLGDSATDDIHDPIGLPLSYYMETAAELDGLLRKVLKLVPGIATGAPPAPPIFDQDQDQGEGTTEGWHS
jgi:protein-tyrosine-phosphatase